MKRKNIIPILLTMAIACTGCSTENKESIKEVNSKIAGQEWIADLVDGEYYIKHSDNSCESLYVGETTFSLGSTPKEKEDSRVAWFKEDYEKIPTLYNGDSLILYTQSELKEVFSFERFEDMGVSFGVIGLFVSPSGRYKVSTDMKKVYTYPKGDTDVLLEHKNDNVIIDSIGGTHINVPEYDQDGTMLRDGFQCISRCGSITGLTPNTTYDIILYEGTEGYHYQWTSNVKILASMETEVTHDFEFQTETIINITIPEYYNTGYYMLDGIGMFRYVKESAYANRDIVNLETLNYNNPNIYPEIKINYGSPTQNDDTKTPASNFSPTVSNGTVNSNTSNSNTSNSPVTSGSMNNARQNTDISTTKYELEQTGKLEATVSIEKKTDNDTLSLVWGEVVSPSGERFQMTNNDSLLSCVFFATEKGSYSINVYSLEGRKYTPGMSYYE